jgi:hypothetical protein
MGADYLTDNAVKALILKGFEEVLQDWPQQISLVNDQSERDSEEYVLLGEVPRLGEYLGTRQFRELRQHKVTVTNKDYDAALKIKKDDLRRDKQGYLELRIREFVQAAQAHWRQLLSTLIANGGGSTSGLAFDGQYFFDDDHSLGDSGTIDNNISVDISALPASVHGIVTAPSPEEGALSILSAVTTMKTFLDDQGHPINEDLRAVAVVCPCALEPYLQSAVSDDKFGNVVPNILRRAKIDVAVYGNPRLDAASWTDKFAVFRADGGRPSFLIQEREKAEAQYIGLDSEHCKIHKETLYVIDTSRAAAYADFRGACLVTMI